MKSERYQEDDDDIELLVDLLFESNFSLSQIAKELNWPLDKVNKKINALGLSWIKERRKKMSRGQTALTAIMQKLLPGEIIINEYHIGDKLKLDVYCEKYKIAAEYHGRQHFYYTSRFYDSKYEFEEAVKRDTKKAEWCKNNNIALVVFRYNDSLTEQSVFDRMLDAIRSSETVEVQKNKRKITDSEAYRISKKRNSEYRKKAYRAIKEKKKNNDRNTGNRDY
jgi:hypothetical protein